jgi:hypothetical protein
MCQRLSLVKLAEPGQKLYSEPNRLSLAKADCDIAASKEINDEGDAKPESWEGAT